MKRRRPATPPFLFAVALSSGARPHPQIFTGESSLASLHAQVGLPLTTRIVRPGGQAGGFAGG